MERRLAAVVLIGAGTWVQWGPGFGLIVLGALLGLSGVEVRAAGYKDSYVRILAKSRELTATTPRQTFAVGLAAAATVVLPVGAAMAVAVWAGVLALGVLTLMYAFVLGWE